MARIYVASSWRNQYYPEVVEALRAAGHEVYDFRNPPHGGAGFHWTDIDENGSRAPYNKKRPAYLSIVKRLGEF